MVHGCSQRVDIRACICRNISELFRAGKGRCAKEGALGQVHLIPIRRNRFGQTEIDHLYLQFRQIGAALGQHDVSWLDIPVDQAMSRRRNQRPRHLHRHFQGRLHLQRALAPDESFGGFAFDQFHRVIAAIAHR